MLMVIAVLLGAANICVNIFTLSLIIKSNKIINDRLSATKLLMAVSNCSGS